MFTAQYYTVMELDVITEVCGEQVRCYGLVASSRTCPAGQGISVYNKLLVQHRLSLSVTPLHLGLTAPLHL